MNKKILFLLISAIPFFTNSQEVNKRIIVVTKEVKTVPTGKKWILKSNSKVKIQVSDGTLQSGTICNASFLSNPHMAGSIYKGDYHNSIGFGIFFSNMEKVPFTNDNTYSLYPISFFDRSFTLSQLSYMKPENIGVSVLQFNAGETVFVGNCINAIEMIEEDLTQKSPKDILSHTNINWDIKAILKMKTPSELIKAYGEGNVEKADGYDKEGNITGEAFLIFRNGKNALDVRFGKKGVNYISCRKKGANWIFPFGLAVGDSLQKVVKINNKDFSIYGFEWDYSGLLESWNNGRLENNGISVYMSTSEKSDGKLYDKLLKEQQEIVKKQFDQGKESPGAHTVIFTTKNSLLRKIGFIVEEIFITNKSGTD